MFFPTYINYPVKCVPSPYRHCLTSFFRPSQLLHYYHYFYKCQKYLYDDICQYHLTDTSTKAHLEKLPLPIIFLHTSWDFLAKFFNDLFKHKKKLKSCMLHWHLLHSNPLWGPVNQVSSLTRWNSRDANLAKLPFMGPALKLQTPLSTPKSKDSSLQHTQPGLSSQWKCKAQRVQIRKPDCDWRDPETANSTPEPKPSSETSHWHSTEPAEQRCDLKIESFWVQSLSPGVHVTLFGPAPVLEGTRSWVEWQQWQRVTLSVSPQNPSHQQRFISV